MHAILVIIFQIQVIASILFQLAINGIAVYGYNFDFHQNIFYTYICKWFAIAFTNRRSNYGNKI